MNFCNENRVYFNGLSSNLSSDALRRSTISAASSVGALTSLKNRRKFDSGFMFNKGSRAHLRLTFILIFFRKLSFVTRSSVSSLSANMTGGSWILRLRHSCFTTSSTVRVGSMRARTVTPPLVVTVFVGTKAGLGLVLPWWGLWPLTGDVKPERDALEVIQNCERKVS